jgi:hypothetical protein
VTSGETRTLAAGIVAGCTTRTPVVHRTCSEAIYRCPDLFENVLCMCSPIVVSMAPIFSAFSELQGISQYQELIDFQLIKMGPSRPPK